VSHKKNAKKTPFWGHPYTLVTFADAKRQKKGKIRTAFFVSRGKKRGRDGGAYQKKKVVNPIFRPVEGEGKECDVRTLRPLENREEFWLDPGEKRARS